MFTFDLAAFCLIALVKRDIKNKLEYQIHHARIDIVQLFIYHCYCHVLVEINWLLQGRLVQPEMIG